MIKNIQKGKGTFRNYVKFPGENKEFNTSIHFDFFFNCQNSSLKEWEVEIAAWALQGAGFGARRS